MSFSNSTTFVFTSSNSFLICHFQPAHLLVNSEILFSMRSCSVHFGQLRSFPGDFCRWLAGSTITTGYIDHHHHQCCECRLESHFDCSHICKLYVKRRGAIQYRKNNNSQHATDASTSVCSTFASVHKHFYSFIEALFPGLRPDFCCYYENLGVGQETWCLQRSWKNNHALSLEALIPDYCIRYPPFTGSSSAAGRGLG